MKKPQAKRSKRRAHPEVSKIDVTAILTKAVMVGKQGREELMTPYEISLRALVKKALKEQSLTAIRTLLDIACEFDLVAPPPEQPRDSGVVIWPGLLDRKPGDIRRKQGRTDEDST